MSEKPITVEIAGIEKDIFQDYIGKTLLNPDKILKSESGGKGIELYSDLLRDAKVGACLQTRRLAVTGREWEVIPASFDKRDVEIADYVKQVLKAVNLDAYRRAALSGLVYGFKPCEIMWEYSEGDVFISKIIPRASRRFVFDINNNLRLLTLKNMIEGEEIPDRKFQVFTNPSDDGSPYGDGLGRLLYWPCWFKKNAIKFWMIFADKFGSPTAVGKYPAGTTKEQQDALLNALDAIQQESAIKIPDTMVIELLEAARQGSVNTYESLCNFMDKQIAQAMLGHTGTSESTPGKLGSEDAANDVRQDYIKSDADLLCESENNQMVKWIVDYNFPVIVASGAKQSRYPKVWIRTEQEKDLEPLARRDKTIYDMGWRPTQKYIEDTYAVLVEAAPQIQVQGEGVAGQGQEFAEGKGCACMAEKGQAQDKADDMTQRLIDEADLNPLIDPLKKLVDEAKSMEDLRDKILDAYKDMDAVDLGSLLQQAFMAADLLGRFEAKQG